MTRLAFMGSKALGARILEAMLSITTVDQIVLANDRSRDATSRFEALAEVHGVPIVGKADADVVLVSGWYSLIPVDARYYGFHPSLLPRYRGQAPIPWQIIHGEEEIGLSLFEFTPGMDEGPIVAQGAVPLGVDQDVAEAIDAIGDLAVEMTREFLPALVDGSVTTNPQNHADATYCGPRRPEDAEIDWEWPAVRIHDFVRAQTRPYDGAFSMVEGERVTIWQTRVDDRSYLAVPGRVCESRGDPVVGCGDGVIRITESSGPELGLGMRLGGR